MEAPKRLSSTDLNAAIKTNFNERYDDNNRNGLKELTCKKCGSTILKATCDVVIHHTPPGCACDESDEMGQSFPLLYCPVCVGQSFPLLYCPVCEGVPATTRTCIHDGIPSKFRPGASVTEVTALAGLSR